MSYYVQKRWGGSERAPSPARMREILAELETADREHPDAWLQHESEWTVAVSESGIVRLESPDGNEWHCTGLSREQALERWILLADGHIDELRALPWQAGRVMPDPAELAQLRAEADAAMLQYDRDFYDRLGPESSTETCAAEPCDRHRIALSAFCRRHHFESVRRRPCVF